MEEQLKKWKHLREICIIEKQKLDDSIDKLGDNTVKAIGRGHLGEIRRGLDLLSMKKEVYIFITNAITRYNKRISKLELKITAQKAKEQLPRDYNLPKGDQDIND